MTRIIVSHARYYDQDVHGLLGVDDLDDVDDIDRV